MVMTLTFSAPTMTGAAEEAKARAKATGKPWALQRQQDGSWLVQLPKHLQLVQGQAGDLVVAKSKVVKPGYDDRNLQGNTAADRAEQDWTEDNYVARSLQVEDDLDRQLDSDASWYASWYVEKHVATCFSLSMAKRVARKHTRDESPATIKRGKRTREVHSRYGFHGWEYRDVVVRTYEVHYTTRVCYAVDGDHDHDHVAIAEVVEHDLAGPAHYEAPVWDTDFESYPEWVAPTWVDTSATYFEAAIAAENKRIG